MSKATRGGQLGLFEAPTPAPPPPPEKLCFCHKCGGNYLESVIEDHLNRCVPPLLVVPRSQERDPLEVECPTCHSTPGMKCRNYRGKGCATHGERARLVRGSR